MPRSQESFKRHAGRSEQSFAIDEFDGHTYNVSSSQKGTTDKYLLKLKIIFYRENFCKIFRRTEIFTRIYIPIPLAVLVISP